MTTQVVTWSRRESPLPICAVLARGEAAVAVAGRVLDSEPVPEIFLGEGVIVIVGEPDTLPWVDGVTWLGRDGSLLCPTLLRPSIDPRLLIAAAHRLAGANGPVVSTPEITTLLRRRAGTLDRAALAEFAEGSAAP